MLCLTLLQSRETALSQPFTEPHEVDTGVQLAVEGVVAGKGAFEYDLEIAKY